MQPVDMTECGPVHRLAGTCETPNGIALTAIDGPSVIDQDIAKGDYRDRVGSAYVMVWPDASQTFWHWMSSQDVDGINCVGGNVRYSDHRNARDVAIKRAHAAVALLGTEP